MVALLRTLPGTRSGGRIPVDIDPAESGVTATGLEAADVEAIWRAVKRLYRSGAHPGIALCVRRHGHIALNRTLGYARIDDFGKATDGGGVDLALDTPICLFSASKAVTGVLVHKLAEQGGIDLDTPVAHYLPRFAQQGKSRVTIADVLSHRAGIATIDLPKAERNAATLADTQRVLDLIHAAPLRHYGKPAYHALTGGFVMGALVEKVTGQSLNEYLDVTLRQPLGMTHFTYGVPREKRAAVASNYVAGMRVRYPVSALVRRVLMVGMDEVVKVSNEPDFMDSVIPAGNLYATAEELSRFYQMLLEGGVYGGKRVLEADTVARALRPRGKPGIDRSLGAPMRYSEGFMLGARGFSLYGPHTPDAYGHLGFMNILGWAHPSRQTSVALLTTGKAVLGPHLIPLVRLLSRLSSRCAA